MIKTEVKRKESNDLPASAISIGKMFLDGDRDLYIRLEGGALAIGENSLVVFSNDELKDFDSFPYLKHCSEIAGKVKLSADLT